jgi:hypothetical protein
MGCGLQARSKRRYVGPDTRFFFLHNLEFITAFVRMYFEDPLLCLTVSATLREKPIPLTGPRQRLADLIAEAGNVSFDPASPLTPIRGPDDDKDPPEDLVRGLEEVNLFGGIASGVWEQRMCVS